MTIVPNTKVISLWTSRWLWAAGFYNLVWGDLVWGALVIALPHLLFDARELSGSTTPRFGSVWE